MTNLNRTLRILSTILFYVAVTAAPSRALQSSKSEQDYVPPELQASDSEVRAHLDSAEKLGQEGKYPEAFQQLQRALDLSVSKGFLSDKALTEAQLGAAYFLRGRLEDAKKQFFNAFSDSTKTKNLVLQADSLIALSSMSQATGKLPEAIDLAMKAVELARKSQNLFIQSRCLGELGRLQFTVSKREEGRNSLDEALRIDRLNHYKWEPNHLVYLAWMTYSPSAPDEAIELSNSARELAAKQENYLAFMLASQSLGQAYVAKGNLAFAIAFLENSRNGVSESGERLFHRPESYRNAMALPYPKIIFLESLALAYQSGKRADEALRSWLELYDTAKGAGFFLAAAEAAHSAAIIYQARKETSKAVTSYELAAENWKQGGNLDRHIDAVTSEAFLLQQSESDKAIGLYEEVLPLLDTAGNRPRQFLIALSIAEIAQPRGDLDRADAALRRAESLLLPDLALPGLEPKFIFELYTREAGIYESKKERLPMMIAMEKAIQSSGGASGEQIAILDREMNAALISLNAREEAEDAYARSDFPKALILYELIQHFEETHAIWAGKGADYNPRHDDPLVNKILDIPFKLVQQPEGSTVLEKNLQEMGPIAQVARLPILIALSNYYFAQSNYDAVVKFATSALPQLRLGENDQPNRWDVQLACELATSLLVQKSLDRALERVQPCLRSAQKFGDPKLLAAAHMTRVFVLQGSGRGGEAEDSLRFLASADPDEPQYYVLSSQLETQQGMFEEATKAERHALLLFEARRDLKGSAWAHMALANSLASPETGDKEDARNHVEAALSVYRQLGDKAGQAKCHMFLGAYFAKNADSATAIEHFSTALKLSREANEPGIQAWAVSSTGDEYRKIGEAAKALDLYRKAAELYHSLGDTANEANQVQKEAEAFDDQNKPADALQTYLQAKRLADDSGSWLPRYWVRRILGTFYETRGDYENALTDVREARAIAETAHQPLNSARASMAEAQTLVTVGDRGSNWKPESSIAGVSRFKGRGG